MAELEQERGVHAQTFEEARYWKADMVWLSQRRGTPPQGDTYASVSAVRKAVLARDAEAVADRLRAQAGG